MRLRVAALTGERLGAALTDLARLRIAVFRHWPYLYQGDADYEQNYLRAYAESDDALVVGAWDDQVLVGASTCAPMEDHAEEFAAPFSALGYDLSQILYCGESVLLPAYRGRGIGHAFFDARETHGRALGRRWSCFCGVIRDENDPRRPSAYQPLDRFWRRRGYEPLDGATAKFSWTEIGGAEIEHDMKFWIRAL